MANVAAAPLSLLIILATVRCDLAKPTGWLTARPLVYAGEISFAFYLVHATVINTLLVSGAFAHWWCYLIVSVACAIALHQLVERPCERAIREWASRRTGLASRPNPRNAGRPPGSWPTADCRHRPRIGRPTPEI